MKKTEMYTALAAYIINLNHSKDGPLSKKDRADIHDSMRAALLMLNEIPEPIEPRILDIALANLLAYLVSNGKTTYVEKVNHLSNIVAGTNLILTLGEQTPIAEVLDMVYDKKNHPFTRILKK